MQNTDELTPTIRKLVTGLRQVARDMVGQSEARMEDTSVEAKGFLSEAMDQYADRVGGYATELAQAIGYVEASPDLLAARELAANVVGRLVTRDIQMGRVSSIRLGGDDQTLYASEAVRAILGGEQDESDIVQDMLVAIERGRSLGAEAVRAQRIAAMMQQSRRAPDKLTLTIQGPQGSGKTLLANWLIDQGDIFVRPTYQGSRRLTPQIIEIGTDGRRFDVRNEVFLDAAEADHG